MKSIVLGMLVAAGCGSRDPDVADGIAFPPEEGLVEPGTPPLTPDHVVQRYLLAWQQGNFEAMYDFLSPDSQQRVPYHQFFAAYQNARNQTTALDIQTQVQSLLIEDAAATATFHSRWQTALFETLEADHLMRLRLAESRWSVVWEPTLVLPDLGHGVTLVFLEEQPGRGLIFDAEDRVMASERQLVTIGVVPGLVQDEAQVVSQLSGIIRLDPETIRQKMISARPDWFVPLADLDFEENVQYHEVLASLTGVQRQAHPVRTYPEGDTGAHVLGSMGGIASSQLQSYKSQGYKGDELVGQTGVEGWGEPFLAGRRGGRLVTMAGNKELKQIAAAPPKPGGNIYLTLDMALQRETEAILGARNGAIVVMTPNGVVRALASYPRYLPEDFAAGIDAETWNGLLNNPNRPLINRVTQGLYPPASVFKIVGAAAAMEHLGYSGETPFFCAGSWNGLGDDFIKKCWLETGHGYVNLREGIAQSCDVVFYELGLTLHREDPNWLANMARAFGLGESIGMLGLDDLAGVVPDNAWKTANRGEPFYDGDAVNMAIGQGDILVTPLQIARMLAAVANGGILYRTQLVRRVSARDTGDQFFEPEVIGTLPISPSTLEMLQNSLFAVIHGFRGTAQRAFQGISYTVAGKTGTAETYIAEPHAWFAGYTPAFEPELVIAVIVEHAGEGSSQAAPLFRAVVDAYHTLRNGGA